MLASVLLRAYYRRCSFEVCSDCFVVVPCVFWFGEIVVVLHFRFVRGKNKHQHHPDPRLTDPESRRKRGEAAARAISQHV